MSSNANVSKLEELKKVVSEEKDIELTRLKTKIDTYKEGTQARLDAQIEYNTIKQQLDNEVITLEDQQRALKAEKDAAAVAAQDEVDKKKLVLDEYIRLKPGANTEDTKQLLNKLIDDLHNSSQIVKLSSRSKLFYKIKSCLVKSTKK